MEDKKTFKKLSARLVFTIILIACLVLTTFALYYSRVMVEDNYFQTGIVKINLNDGKPIITEDEYLFEPGMTVVKNFTLENEGTCDVYYRLYLDKIDGDLAEAINIEINDGTTSIYKGKASGLIKENVISSKNTLAINENKEFTITFHMEESEGNERQDKYLAFDLKADAVQVKNNPSGIFE